MNRPNPQPGGTISGTSVKTLRIIFNRFFISILIVIFFLPIIPIQHTDAQVIEVSIKINLDPHYTEFFIEEGSRHNFSYPGKVKCKIDGKLDDEEYIVVHLRASDQLSWSVGAGPTSFSIRKSCVKNINVSVVVPNNERNRTVNRIWVEGDWNIEPYDKISNKVNGDVVGDYFDAKVVRHYVSIDQPFDAPGESEGFFTQSGWLCIGGLMIIIISIIAIIVFYYKVY